MTLYELIKDGLSTCVLPAVSIALVAMVMSKSPRLCESIPLNPVDAKRLRLTVKEKGG